LKVFFSIFLLWFISHISAQEIVVKGRVTDSLSNPLPYANIMAETIYQKKSPVFTMTDENGHFKLHLLRKNVYQVTVLYMGYQSAVFKVDSLSNGFNKSIVLKPDKSQLDEVVIVADLPVTVKQDTVIYKTDKFKTGEERKLKDVLKKLPGIEVDKNGAVSVMGKKVSKVLVEGKPFFGGGTKLAVDNIPADAVAQVIAIDDYNNISFMKGLTDEQKMIINIKLKEGKKHFVFGDMEAGGGNDRHYLGKANLFYYSPKTNLSFIGNINNTGEEPLSLSDFMRFEGGIASLGKLKSSFQNFRYLMKMIGAQHFLDKQNKFAALQWQQDFGNKIEFSTYGIFLNQKVSTQQTDKNRYLGAQILTENRETIQNQDNINGFAKMHFRYKASIYNYFDMEMSGNIKDADFDSQKISIIEQDLQNIFETQQDKAYYLTNSLAWHHKINRKNTLRFLQKITFDQNTPVDFWQTNQAFLPQILALQPSSIYKLGQDKRSNNRAWDIELKHYWLINNNHHLYTSLGNHLFHQKFYTHSYQILDNATNYDLTPSGFHNDLNLNLNDLFGGLQYKLRFNGFIVKAGLFAHYYSWQFSGDYTQNKAKKVMLPEFSLRKKIGLKQKFKFEYRLKANIPEISKYLNYYYLTGFNTVAKGNPELTYEQVHQFNASYSHFTLVNNLNYYVRLQYRYKPESIKNKIVYTGIDYYKRPLLTHFPDQSYNVVVFVKKSFKYFYISFKPYFNLSQYHQNIQEQWNKIQTTNQIYEFKTGSYLKKYPNIDLGITVLANHYKMGEQTHLYTQNIPFINLYYDYKNFNFKAEYQYIHTKDLSVTHSSYNIANFSLIYQKKNSPWGLELQGQNLFNNRVIKTYQSSEYIISDTDILVQQRIVMLKLRYKL